MLVITNLMVVYWTAVLSNQHSQTSHVAYLDLTVAHGKCNCGRGTFSGMPVYLYTWLVNDLEGQPQT
jgi:hypothetical protein